MTDLLLSVFVEGNFCLFFVVVDVLFCDGAHKVLGSTSTDVIAVEGTPAQTANQ